MTTMGSHTPVQLQFSGNSTGSLHQGKATNFTAGHVLGGIEPPWRSARRPNTAFPSVDARVPVLNRLGRDTGAFVAVLVLHLAAIWGLYNGLNAPPLELLVPVQMNAELLEAPAPVVAPTPTPPTPKPSTPTPAPKPAPITVKPQPRPVISQALTPPVTVPAAALAPIPLPPATEPSTLQASTTAAQVPNTNPNAVPRAAATPASSDQAPSAPANVVHATAALELPSSDAQYLQNPKPRYPPVSMRLDEQGTVLVQVLVSDKGIAKDVRLKGTSGFFRLDNAALEAVARWRFVPGKRAGVPEAMWFTVPITFGLR